MCAALTAGAATGADLTLRGKGKLSGEFVSMGGDGVITLLSPISKEALKVDAGAVEKVDFGVAGFSVELPNQRIHLVNGDVIPARVMSLDGGRMVVDSPHLGELEIPRGAVDSIKLGISPEKLVYSGPNGFKRWNKESGGSDGWEFKEKRMVASGNGVVTSGFELPDEFLIRFRCEWSGSPHLGIAFADTLEKTGREANRYLLEFSDAGFQLQRESPGKRRPIPIALLGRKPSEFAGRAVEIEIRVDRARGRLHLYLDGKLEGRYTDPIPDLPEGSGISLISKNRGRGTQSVGWLEIAEWDEETDRYRSEERGDTGEDSLIERYGARFSGRLESIKPLGEVMVYRFKSDFQKQALELPEKEVSVVFMKSVSGGRSVDDFEGLVLRLEGAGELKVGACEFAGDRAFIRHSLLGEVTLERSAIRVMERRRVAKAKRIENE